MCRAKLWSCRKQLRIIENKTIQLINTIMYIESPILFEASQDNNALVRENEKWIISKCLSEVRFFSAQLCTFVCLRVNKKWFHRNPSYKMFIFQDSFRNIYNLRQPVFVILLERNCAEQVLFSECCLFRTNHTTLWLYCGFKLNNKHCMIDMWTIAYSVCLKNQRNVCITER